MANVAVGTQVPERTNSRPIWVLAVCICVAYLLPYHVHPFRAFHAEWLALFGVVVAAAFFAEQNAAIVKIPLVSSIPLGLAAIVTAQAGFGMLGVNWDAILPIGYFFIATMAMVLGATVAAERDGREKICNGLASVHLCAGVVSVFIATLQFVDAGALFAPFVMHVSRYSNAAIRPYANVGQPNQLALLLCLSIASAWWLYQTSRLRKGAVIGIVLALTWGLALAQSRIGWLIMPVFALWIWLWRQKSGYKTIAAPVIVGHLLLYACLVIALPTIASVLGVVTDSPMERIGASANSQRLVLMQQALQISLSHPLLGAGWYEFGPQQVQIGADFGESTYAQHSHNLILNFAAELGWPITILVFGALAYWFYRGCLRKEISKEVAFATLFFMAVLMHSLVEFPLWYAYVLLPVVLLMGMVHQEQFGSRTIRLSRIYLVVLFCVMSLGLVAVATDYRRVVVGFRALGWQNLGLKADEGTTDKPDFTLFPHFYDYFRFAKTKARENMSAVEIAFMERVARRFGYAPVMMRMSLIYALNSRPEDAVRSMETIRRLHSANYPEAYDAWKGMAATHPDKYESVFKRLPEPDRVFVKPGPA